MSMSNDLCEELIVEILLRLPPKSLLRFRSLSKSLCARIDSPGFIRLYTPRSPKKFMFIHEVHDKGKNMYTMYSEDQLSSYAEITPLDHPFTTDITHGTYISIVGSCNGLVCLYEADADVIHLWNPSIRRKLTLRDIPSSLNTNTCKFTHGFGFDPTIDDYKILRISKACTFLYTMKMNTWQEIASPDPPVDYIHSSQCLFNGALHWVAYGYSIHDVYILKFDLSSEIFSTIKMPTLGPCAYNDLCIIKGCLAVISISDDYDSRTIWVRNTVGVSWSSLVLEVDEHEPMQSIHGCILYSRYNKGIVVYNPGTKAQSRLVTLGCHDDDIIIDMITCTESLVLLDMGTSCDWIKRSKSSKRVKFYDLIKGIKSSKRVKFSDLIKGIKSSKRRKFS